MGSNKVQALDSPRMRAEPPDEMRTDSAITRMNFRRIRAKNFLRQTTAYLGFKSRPIVPLHNSMTTHTFVVCGLFRIQPIHPHHPFMKKWDMLSVVLLIYTAIVTPYETAFPDASLSDYMFAINRAVDMCFLFDMVMRFFLMYRDEWSNVWIAQPALIVRHYLKGWFVVDLVSVVPFDLINFFVGSATVQKLRLMRVLRLLRLMKIIRVIQGTDMFTRWEAKMSMNYATLALAKFGFIVLMISHWIACIFRFVVDIENSVDETGAAYNWLTTHRMGDVPLAQMPASIQYLAALYWSVMTLTTIGYGDVVPSTLPERALSIACMLLGAGTYAYVVGGVCQILNSMDASTTEFHQTLDTLNEYATQNQLPADLTARLREYFHSSRSLLRDKQNLDLLLTMSPGLRGEVSVFNNQWIASISFFRCDNPLERAQFITALALVLRPECFPPNEYVVREGELNTKMYLVQRGLATKSKVVYAGGTYFGEDIILNLRQRKVAVRAFSYLHVQVLSKYDLEDIMATGLYPTVYRSIRRQVLKTAFRNHFVSTATRIHRIRRSVRRLKRPNGADGGQVIELPTGVDLRGTPRISVFQRDASDDAVEQIVEGVSSSVQNTTGFKDDELAERLTQRLEEVVLRLARLEKYLLPNVTFDPPGPRRRDSLSRHDSLTRRDSLGRHDSMGRSRRSSRAQDTAGADDPWQASLQFVKRNSLHYDTDAERLSSQGSFKPPSAEMHVFAPPLDDRAKLISCPSPGDALVRQDSVRIMRGPPARTSHY
ncbi:voltage-gated ion channel superfamily [Achlya hypogyna]|uniref:Voltage-gated ion channel superfamily n=1 Tax=Achlya hypogyna TaxID=1202772 RepID=A0A1V9ZAS6_ACHHY|nr:voltage-gated ion channel superfamily [Achlya hypogyna]